MSTETADAARSARMSRRAGILGAVVAASSHSSLGAHTAPAVAIAGGLFVAAAGIATTAEMQGFPVEVIWITGLLTGTIAGAVAAVLVSLIVSPKAQARHHLLRLALAFVGGLAIAPFALGYTPHPQNLPLAFHIFGLAALCAFGAPALAIALHKRSENIADSVIDRVTTARQAREERERDEHEDGGP